MDARIRQAESAFAHTPDYPNALRLGHAYARAGLAEPKTAVAIRDFLMNEGVPVKEIPAVVLYAATEYNLQHQEPLDFSSLLVRPPQTGSVYSNFPPFDFRGNISLSTQAGHRHYSEPQQLLDDPTGYTAWEGLVRIEGQSFCPYRRKDVYGWNDPEDEEYEELQAEVLAAQASPLAEVDLQYDEIMYTDPEYALHGILYGIPHSQMFSVNDFGVIPWGSTEQIQDIFDFLRARFGMLPYSASYRRNPDHRLRELEREWHKTGDQEILLQLYYAARRHGRNLMWSYPNPPFDVLPPQPVVDMQRGGDLGGHFVNKPNLWVKTFSTASDLWYYVEDSDAVINLD